MNIVELKDKIKSNTLDDTLIILQYTDNMFIAHSYIHAIATNKKLEIKYIENLADCSNQVEDLFNNQLIDNTLYVLITDKFESNITNINNYKNVIIVCKDFDKDLNIKDYVIKMPKLEEFQIISYIKAKCKGLDDNQAKILYNINKGDINAIETDLNKLYLFDTLNQSYVFNDLFTQHGFINSKNNIIFALSTAILKKDISTISTIVKYQSQLDIEPFALIGLLKKNFKNIIDIKFNLNASPATLNISYKQFMAIKINSDKFTSQQIIKSYKFLNDIDYNIKTGKLDIKQDEFLDYIICNLIALS